MIEEGVHKEEEGALALACLWNIPFLLQWFHSLVGCGNHENGPTEWHIFQGDFVITQKYLEEVLEF